jgi:hypothetical protein
VIVNRIDKEPFLTVFVGGRMRRNRWKRFKESFVELDHRAEAAVLMRSLRVPLPAVPIEVEKQPKLTHHPISKMD